MFGYIREYPPELKLKHHTLYRAVYCGVCKSLGRCAGQCSRPFLPYDAVFLALIRLTLEDVPITVRKARCILHPLKKHPMMEPNAALDYTARAIALLVSGKLADDRSDERGLKGLTATALYPFGLHAQRRAEMPELYEKVQKHLQSLSELEEKRVSSFDEPAEPMALLGADVLSEGLEESAYSLARTIGYHAAKWVYAADALDDLEKDKKGGAYNPFIYLYDGVFGDAEAILTEAAMRQTLCEIEKALDLVDFRDEDIKELTYHILYEGMRRKTHALAWKNVPQKVESSVE